MKKILHFFFSLNIGSGYIILFIYISICVPFMLVSPRLMSSSDVPLLELGPQCFCKHHKNQSESACNIKFLHWNLLCHVRASHKDIKHSYEKQQSSRNYTTMTLFRHQPSQNLFKMFDVAKYVNDIQLLGDKKLHELVKTLQSAAFESARSAVFFMMITYLYCLLA